MFQVPPDMEGTDIVIEIEGADEQTAAELRKVFDGNEEDVTFAHAFGGAGTVAVLTKLTQAALEKLVGAWTKLKLTAPKTKVKVGKGVVELHGFSVDEVEKLFKLPQFQRMARGATKK